MKPVMLYGTSTEPGYLLELPDGQADWRYESGQSVWWTWERARSMSMLANLHRGDILWDIGSEHGSLSAFYARHIVGGDAMCLFEPTPELWPNIRQTWEANDLLPPRSCWAGFVSHESSLGGRVWTRQWPPEAAGDEECPAMAYRSLAEPHDGIYTITLDDFALSTSIVPRALTIDVEGAEYWVLLGAREMLARSRPLVWCSIHDEMARRDHGVAPRRSRELMRGLGYEERHLGTDHEQHWLFYDPALEVTL